MGGATCSSSANRLCASSDTSLFIPKPIDYIRTAYLVMSGQSDGDPLDQDLHSELPSPLISSAHGDRASESYAPQTVPSSTENLHICPPIDVPLTVIPYHLEYSYTSNPLSLPQTPIATRQLEPHANSKRDIPSFELDFAASLFEGVIPGTASGGRQHKKFEWNAIPFLQHA